LLIIIKAGEKSCFLGRAPFLTSQLEQVKNNLMSFASKVVLYKKQAECGTYGQRVWNFDDD